MLLLARYMVICYRKLPSRNRVRARLAVLATCHFSDQKLPARKNRRRGELHKPGSMLLRYSVSDRKNRQRGDGRRSGRIREFSKLRHRSSVLAIRRLSYRKLPSRNRVLTKYKVPYKHLHSGTHTRATHGTWT
jgi:hypothetical protein